MVPEETELKIYHAERDQSLTEACETYPTVSLLGYEKPSSLRKSSEYSPPIFYTKTKENPIFFTRKCTTNKKYIPLEHRTKTLADLKQEDPKPMWGVADKYQMDLSKRFEQKRIRIKEELIENAQTYDDDFMFE